MNLKKFRRLLAFVLAVLVAFSATPVTYAAEAGEAGYETPVDENQENEGEPSEGEPGGDETEDDETPAEAPAEPEAGTPEEPGNTEAPKDDTTEESEKADDDQENNDSDGQDDADTKDDEEKKTDGEAPAEEAGKDDQEKKDDEKKEEDVLEDELDEEEDLDADEEGENLKGRQARTAGTVSTTVYEMSGTKIYVPFTDKNPTIVSELIGNLTITGDASVTVKNGETTLSNDDALVDGATLTVGDDSTTYTIHQKNKYHWTNDFTGEHGNIWKGQLKSNEAAWTNMDDYGFNKNDYNVGYRHWCLEANNNFKWFGLGINGSIGESKENVAGVFILKGGDTAHLYGMTFTAPKTGTVVFRLEDGEPVLSNPGEGNVSKATVCLTKNNAVISDSTATLQRERNGVTTAWKSSYTFEVSQGDEIRFTAVNAGSVDTHVDATPIIEYVDILKEAPTDVTVDYTAGASATVKWNVPIDSENVAKYYVYLGEDKVGETDTENLSYELKGLEFSKQYTVTVKSVKSDDTVLGSEEASFTTAAARTGYDIVTCDYEIKNKTINVPWTNQNPTTVEEVKAAIKVSDGATVSVVRGSVALEDGNAVAVGDIVRITAEDGTSTNDYKIEQKNRYHWTEDHTGEQGNVWYGLYNTGSEWTEMENYGAYSEGTDQPFRQWCYDTGSNKYYGVGINGKKGEPIEGVEGVVILQKNSSTQYAMAFRAPKKGLVTFQLEENEPVRTSNNDTTLGVKLTRSNATDPVATAKLSSKDTPPEGWNEKYTFEVEKGEWIRLEVVNNGNADAHFAATPIITYVDPAPDAPTGLEVSGVTATSAKISWTASDSAASYKVYDDTTLRGTVTVTEYTLENLTPNTTYDKIKVIAVDAEGNESEPAKVSSFTTKKMSYTVSVSANDSIMGTVSIEGQTGTTASFEDGSPVTVKAEANAEYRFVKWVDAQNDGLKSETNSYTFNVKEDIDLKAVFEKIPTHSVNVTVNNGMMGKVSIDDGESGQSASGTYKNQTKITLKAEAINGYHFVKWVDMTGVAEGGEGTELSKDNSYTYIVSKNAQIQAVFARTEYSLTLLIEGDGTVSSNASGALYLNDKVTVIAKAADGYRFVGWKDQDGNTIAGAGASYEITITGNTKLTAVFEEIPTHSITATVDNAVYGTAEVVTAAGTDGKYREGSSVTVKATAKTGYHFVKWTKSGSLDPVSTSAEYTFTVKEAVDLVAVFEKTMYSVSVSTADSKLGSVKISTESTDGSFQEGSQVTVVATEENGYRFKEWQENGKKVENATASYTFTIMGNRTLTAVFEKVYTITVGVSSSDMGCAYIEESDSKDIYVAGAQLTAVAVADPGYRFIEWTDGLLSLSKQERYTFTADRDLTLTARFEKIEKPIAVDVTKDTMKVEWPAYVPKGDEAGKNVEGYFVYLNGVKQKNPSKARIGMNLRGGSAALEADYMDYLVKDTRYIFEGLNPATEYEVRIETLLSTQNADGTSAFTIGAEPMTLSVETKGAMTINKQDSPPGHKPPTTLIEYVPASNGLQSQQATNVTTGGAVPTGDKSGKSVWFMLIMAAYTGVSFVLVRRRKKIDG